ncbi:MAG: M48 family metallopeptidase [Vampirovibrionales bacterium]|nr:M48 family metallopeptidase [Vampirovibrionales bacterium]
MMIMMKRWLLSAFALTLFMSFMLGGASTFAQAAPSAQYEGRVETQVSVSAAAEQAQAEALLQRILSANGLSAQKVAGIRLTPDKTLNAATDGRQIVFTQELWRVLKTDDQRAFVISHELSHITQQHVPKTQLRRLGLLAFGRWAQSRFSRDGALTGPLLNTATQAGLALTELTFSRQQEYGADEMGIQYLTRAGFKPQAAIETLEVLDRASPTRTPQFMLSHPLSKNRIRELSRRYQTQAPR